MRPSSCPSCGRALAWRSFRCATCKAFLTEGFKRAQSMQTAGTLLVITSVAAMAGVPWLLGRYGATTLVFIPLFCSLVGLGFWIIASSMRQREWHRLQGKGLGTVHHSEG